MKRIVALVLVACMMMLCAAFAEEDRVVLQNGQAPAVVGAAIYDAAGTKVADVEEGALELGDLPVGQVRALTEEEIKIIDN